MGEHLRWERRNAVSTITIDRPAKRNAMSLQMWRDLRAVANDSVADGAARVVVVRGVPGGDFSAGADVEEFGTAREGEENAAEYSRVVDAALTAITSLPVPSIAVIEGYCIGGGCELALACDLRISSATARFGVTPAKLGIILSLPSVQRLVAAIGPAAAKYLLLTANLVPADRALAMGLTHEVHEPAQLEDAGRELAERVASLAAVSHRGTRAIVSRIVLGQTAPDEELDQLYRSSYRSDEYQEGVQAFLAGRTPDFGSPPPAVGEEAR